MNWYNDPKFNSYWQNYNTFMNNGFKTQEFLKKYNQVSEAWKNAHNETMKQLKDIDWAHDVNFHPKSCLASNTNEDIEFEIDPEVLKFYEKSFEFKRQRKEKEKKQQSDETRHITGEQLNLLTSQTSSNAPLERAGLEREEDLTLMYGDKAKEIQYLETTIKMIHDKNFDLYQPKFWPSLPLRIKFN